jgi:hypothetical protein
MNANLKLLVVSLRLQIKTSRTIPTLLLLLTFFSIQTFAQVDTIYTNNKKIPCIVKEITPEMVKFNYPEEELINSIYVINVQQIIFKSGRVQVFAPSTSFKTVLGADDFLKVTVTSIESEIKGMYNLGDVSAKAQAATIFSNMEKVKATALDKIRIKCAMLGANIIFIRKNSTSGYRFDNKGYTDSYEGVAYTQVIPNYVEFEQLIGSKSSFSIVELIEFTGKVPDFSKVEFHKHFELQKINNVSGLIVVNGKIDTIENKTFRVIHFSKDYFTLVWEEKDRIYNIKISM